MRSDSRFFFFLMIRRPPKSPLFPYPPLSQSASPAAQGGPLAAPAAHGTMPLAAGATGLGETAVERETRHDDVPAEEPEPARSEEHTSELQSRQYLVCRLLLEKKKTLDALEIT